MTAGSRFRIVPDPPVAGKELEVTYLGPASEVVYQVDGRKPVKVKPDKDGRFVIKPVPSGEEIFFDDQLGYPGFLQREIDLKN